MAAALQNIGARKVSLSMASFGGTSQKPLALHGTAPWLEDLQRMARDLRGTQTHRSETLCTVSEGGSVTGRRDALKASEEYTEDFTESWHWQ